MRKRDKNSGDLLEMFGNVKEEDTHVKRIIKSYEEDSRDGIIRVMQNGIEYTVWTRADIVTRYIKDCLKKRFHGKLIIRELNKIDLSIPEENLPIEIQATIAGPNRISYAQWEKVIRSQIEQNIINYDRCWFFFDSELLRCIQNAGKQMSINMDWFRKLMKEEKLKVFTVSYDGIIEHKEYKDFDILSEKSQTCPIAAETDDMTLNGNKMKIFANVTKGYIFTQEEIDKFDNDYRSLKVNEIDNVSKKGGMCDFLIRQNDERAKLYGYVLHAIGSLPIINQLLNRECNKDGQYSGIRFAKILGIFNTEGHSKKVITEFIDRFDICKYFPGYLRNKEIWNKLKGHNLNTRQFGNIVEGKSDVIKGIDYYWK